MKKVILFFILGIACHEAYSQSPRSAIVLKMVDSVITVDGILNENIWKYAGVNDIDRIFSGENYGNTGTADESGYWKAVWTDTGIYVAVNITDDKHYNDTASKIWQPDRLEIYFNTNVDNTWGPCDTISSDESKGRYKIAGIVEDSTKMDSTKIDTTWVSNFEGANYAFKRDSDESGNFTFELYMPWLAIPDSAKNIFIPDTVKNIGFDIYFCDDDGPEDTDGAGRNLERIVWSNDATFGSETECLYNMADAGLIRFSNHIVGINTLSISADFNLYMFSNDIFNISLKNTDIGQIRIYNLMGVLVKNIPYSGNKNIKINISDIKPGLYIVALNGASKKFIKK